MITVHKDNESGTCLIPDNSKTLKQFRQLLSGKLKTLRIERASRCDVAGKMSGMRQGFGGQVRGSAMNQVGHWLLNVLAVLSLLLSAATVVLWPRTIRRQEKLTFVAQSGIGNSFATTPHAIEFVRQDNLRQFRAAAGPVRGGWSYSSYPWGMQETFLLYKHVSPTGSSTTFSLATITHSPAHPKHHFIGFGWNIAQLTHPSPPNGAMSTYQTRSFVVPLWFLTSVFLLLPAWRLRYFLQQRRRFRVGCCESCGYDLRATPEKCPECGRLVKSQATI